MAFKCVVVLGLCSAAFAACPNLCNGHGRCVGVNKCDCFGQWGGGDCSQRKCPTGSAWADVATAEDTAHAEAECSNRGVCNPSTGECTCMPGYEGLACNRNICPGDCSGNGECHSMRRHAEVSDRGTIPVSGVSVKNIERARFPYTKNWDADMLHGCTCDAGYGGWDCSGRLCPRGDDPMTGSQLSEIQLLKCALDPTAADYTAGKLLFRLSFEGALTAPFDAHVDAATLKGLLEALPSVGEVTVTYSSGTLFCKSGSTANVISIEFLDNHGSLPRLMVLDSKGKFLTAAVDNGVQTAAKGELLGTVLSRAGTTEDLPCSGRGKCNEGTGVCSCFTGFSASDGKGGQGERADCGYAYLPITSCPGTSLECSGHGTCAGSPSYGCTCYTGWQGGDCSERSCPKGLAWFDEPSDKDTAHALAECSNKGKCNRVTGQCACQSMFEGSACERMTCPGKTSPLGVCSGHGRCLSMSALAEASSTGGDPEPFTYGVDPANTGTWDARSTFGCLCDVGYVGYDCGSRSCPIGNDVTLKEWDVSVVDEVQELSCKKTSGTPSFRLSFRGKTTAAIAHDATVDKVEAALEALSTIDDITVALYTQGSPPPDLAKSSPDAEKRVIETDKTKTVCWTGAATNEVFLTFSFQTEHGDVPPIRVLMDDTTKDAYTGMWAQDALSDWDKARIDWGAGDPSKAYAKLVDYADFGGSPPTRVNNQAAVFNLANSMYPTTGVRAREWTKGTSIDAECSDRGICNRETGTCQCFLGFGSSDDNRKVGLVDNCGAREPHSFPKSLRGV